VQGEGKREEEEAVEAAEKQQAGKQ
jgi:hypothetical protein